MKRITILLAYFTIMTLSTNAQSGANREPAGASRAPAGARSGRESGGSSDRGGNKEAKTKDGKTSVSQGAKETAKAIKEANSIDGKGRNMTETQRNEASRQIGDEKAKAAADGRNADAKFYGREQGKLYQKKQ